MQFDCALESVREDTSAEDTLDLVFTLAGSRYDNRGATIEKLRLHEQVKLVREPDHREDEHAIHVKTTADESIGYVGRKLALRLAPYFDRSDWDFNSAHVLALNCTVSHSVTVALPLPADVFSEVNAVRVAGLSADAPCCLETTEKHVVYLMITCDEASLTWLLSRLDDTQIQYDSAGKAYRQGADGKTYTWYVRFSSGVTEEKVRSFLMGLGVRSVSDVGSLAPAETTRALPETPSSESNSGNKVAACRLPVVGSFAAEGMDVVSSLKLGSQLQLCRDKDNPKDSQAVRVVTLSEQYVGYLTKEHAKVLAGFCERAKEPITVTVTHLSETHPHVTVAVRVPSPIRTKLNDSNLALRHFIQISDKDPAKTEMVYLSGLDGVRSRLEAMAQHKGWKIKRIGRPWRVAGNDVLYDWYVIFEDALTFRDVNDALKEMLGSSVDQRFDIVAQQKHKQIDELTAAIEERDARIDELERSVQALDLGYDSEENVKEQLIILKAEGVLSDFKQTERYSKADHNSVDFFVTYKNKSVKLQVKSSEYKCALFLKHAREPIGCVNGQCGDLQKRIVDELERTYKRLKHC